MSTNVYNVIWADDDIDALIVRYEKRFADNDLHIIGRAHNGEELEQCLAEKMHMTDAVIVDANFNESETDIDDERDTSGLSFTRSHLLKQYSSIPFILFTQRSDEMIAEKYRNTPKFKSEFPRHNRWFKKNDEDELIEMFEAIKKEADIRKTTSFIIRNRYQKELSYADVLGEDSYNYIFEVLCRDWDNTLGDMREPFATARKIVEQIFGQCETVKLIPPISGNTNGTGDYFLYKAYSPWDELTHKRIPQFKMKGDDLMPKPLAQSLVYFLNMTQDGAHRKKDLSLKVDEYFNKTKDVLLLRSVLFILIDIIKWFIETWKCHLDPDVNEIELWEKV